MGIPSFILVPGMLCVYALAFISGGVYYLEQRVSRIRDQFPERGILATITGYTALGIGILAALSMAIYFVNGSPDSRLGALVATLSGAGYWVYHIHIDLTPASRIRDALLAAICAMLALLTGWWVATS